MARETLEETAWQFAPQAIVGIYLWKNPANQKSFLRVAYSGIVTQPRSRAGRWTTGDSAGALADP